MDIRDKITVISGWLGDNSPRANEARKFFDELNEENTRLANELERVKNNSSISDVVERVSRMKDDSGREGCTYGDTDYDSMTVVYGYNLAIDDVTDTLSKL
jgi:hypothetical protein